MTVHFRIPLQVAGYRMFINGSAFTEDYIPKGGLITVRPLEGQPDGFSSAQAEVIETLQARNTQSKWGLVL